MLQTQCQVHNSPITKDNSSLEYPSKMSLSNLLFLPSLPKHTIISASTTSQIPTPTFQNPHKRNSILLNLVSLAAAVTLNLNTPLSSQAIPSLNFRPPPPSPTTPFSESKNLDIGLENGRIRPCPSTNPGCITTNPKSSSFTFPLTIPENDAKNAIQKLQEAILKTQKNPQIQVVEDTKDGKYLQAEVDGASGRDVMEFLVKGDVVVYRTMAKKVIYIYPFTTALGDSKGQEERVKKIVDELGWYAPSFDTNMDVD